MLFRSPLAALPETIVIRKALEETSARLAAERAQRSQVIALLAQLERQREASRAGDRNAFHQADEAFHGAIAEAAGYRGIWTLVEQVKRDRSILAVILCGSLSHDTVWAKSDIDLVLVTIDDKKTGNAELSLYVDGINVHASLMPRAAFRTTVEAACADGSVVSGLVSISSRRFPLSVKTSILASYVKRPRRSGSSARKIAEFHGVARSRLGG